MGAKLQSWAKMLRKMHLVCLILEYFPLKPGSLEILPPTPPPQNVTNILPTTNTGMSIRIYAIDDENVKF